MSQNSILRTGGSLLSTQGLKSAPLRIVKMSAFLTLEFLLSDSVSAGQNEEEGYHQDNPQT